MKDRISNVVLGIVLIGFGVIFAGNAFDLWDIGIFFRGMWTLIIIIPAVMSIIRNGFGLWNAICLVFGVLLLLNAQGLIPFDVLQKLIIPVILVFIGLQIIFRDRFFGKINKMRQTVSEVPEYFSLFSTATNVLMNELFVGANITALFSSSTLDLRNAIINGDTVINVTCAFSGTKIILSNDVNVKVSSIPIFGGVSNKHISVPNKSTVYVNATCLFGGVDIL